MNYYEKNKEKCSIRHKTYYQNNKEKIKARSKARYEANKEVCIAQASDWKKKNPKKFKSSQDKWLINNPSYNMYHNAKRRAKDIGVPFDISFRDIHIPEYCPVLGIKLYQEGLFETSGSLDKVIPEKGYVKGNIKVISMRANRLKSDGTLEEFRQIVNYIESMT